MSNLKYLKGRRGEYKCQRILEKEGYFTWRTPGSKSNWDVLAVFILHTNPDEKPIFRWVQVKTYKPTKKDFYKVENTYLPNQISKELWVLEPYKKLKIYYF